MEKRAKKTTKSEANCEVIPSVGIDVKKRHGEFVYSLENFKENLGEDRRGKDKWKVVSEGDSKHSRMNQNKQTRSDFERELFPSRSPVEIRERSKLPPFRAGRYIPSDGYLYSSWSSAATDEISTGKSKDVECKSRIGRTKADKIESQEKAKETRIQSASFHGVETKRVRPKLRTRCRSTDCGRVTGSDRSKLNNKTSNFECKNERKPRCRSADISKLSFEHGFDYHTTASSPTKSKSSGPDSRCSCGQPMVITEQSSLSNECDFDPTEQTLTSVNETEVSSSSVVKTPSQQEVKEVPCQEDSSQKAMNGRGRSSSINDLSTEKLKEKSSSEKALSSTENSTTKKGKVKELAKEVGSCVSKLTSKNSPPKKEKSNTESSAKRTKKTNDSEIQAMHDAGVSENECSLTTSYARKNISNTDKMDKPGKVKSSLVTSPLGKNKNSEGESKNEINNTIEDSKFTPKISTQRHNNKKVNPDVNQSLMNKEKISTVTNSRGKHMANSETSPQRNSSKNCSTKVRLGKDVDYSTKLQTVVRPSSREEESMDKAAHEDENLSSRSSFSQTKDANTDLSQVVSAQMKTELLSGENRITQDCVNEENGNVIERKDNKMKADVDTKVEKAGTVLCGSDIDDNCPDTDTENNIAFTNQSDDAVSSWLKSDDTSGKPNEVTKTLVAKGSDQGRSVGNVKLQRNYRTKVTKRPSNEIKPSDTDRLIKTPSDKDKRSSVSKNSSEKDQLLQQTKNPEVKKPSPRRRLSSGISKYSFEKKTVEYKASEQTESNRKLAFARRESYSKQLREKNMRNAELKKKQGMQKRRNDIRLQQDSAITVKIKHVKSRRLLRRNVAYVKREQKIHFSEEHDHDSWVLFTVMLSPSIVGHVPQVGLDVPDGGNSLEFYKPTKAIVSCVLPKPGNIVPKVKNILVRSPRSHLKRLSLLPVTKLRWSLFDAMVMFIITYRQFSIRILKSRLPVRVSHNKTPLFHFNSTRSISL